MNLAGYVAVGRGHHEGDVFTMISVHIVGMYGLVLVVGDLIDRFGRRRALVAGLLLMTVSNAALVWLGGVGGMSLALLGLGLGWNSRYVAATTELVSLTAPVRARPPRRLLRPALELRGGLARPARRARLQRVRGVAALALCARPPSRPCPALWLAARPAPLAPLPAGLSGLFATILPRRTHGPPLSCL